MGDGHHTAVMSATRRAFSGDLKGDWVWPGEGRERREHPGCRESPTKGPEVEKTGGRVIRGGGGGRCGTESAGCPSAQQDTQVVTVR